MIFGLFVINNCYDTPVSKGVPSCQKTVQQNVKGIECLQTLNAGLCRNTSQAGFSAFVFKK
jgi:hypothetical protein